MYIDDQTLLSSLSQDVQQFDAMGEEHHSTSAETPMKPDAFAQTPDEKIARIQYHFAEIMDALGLDLNDESLQGTPYRVAKMFVREIFAGLDPGEKPDMTVFENNYRYGEMLVERNIQVFSHCEHHFAPMIGMAHVAYISTGRVIGLSKINRIVDYYARRPQVQERLTLQVYEELRRVLMTEHVAVVVEAQHMCVSTRGVKDVDSNTVTMKLGGRFRETETRRELMSLIQQGSSLRK